MTLWDQIKRFFSSLSAERFRTFASLSIVALQLMVAIFEARGAGAAA
jgi:hypothetical protein